MLGYNDSLLCVYSFMNIFLQICPPKSQTDHAPTASNKRKLEETRVVNKESDIKKHEEPGHSSDKNSEENDQNPNPTGGNGESQESQKARMLTVATVAMNELCCLISTDRPLWLKPLNEAHGVVLNPDMYVNLNPEIVQLLASGKREESSKEELIVRSSGKQLVDSILDSVSNLYIIFSCYTFQPFNILLV